EARLGADGGGAWASRGGGHHRGAPGEAAVEVRRRPSRVNTPEGPPAEGVFVDEKNPLARISVPQLFAIFGGSPEITRWGQLGLGGEWADRPIRIYIPPRAAPNAMSMQIIVLKNQPWNAAAKEGSIAETARAIASDPAAIG